MTSTKNPLAASAVVDNVTDAKQSTEQDALDAKPAHPPFATYTNLIVIFWAFFSFAVAGGLSGIATFVYIPMGMSLIWQTQVGIITFCLNMPLTLYFASLSDNLKGKWSRWGRRKPFIVASIPFVCFGAIMLAFPQESKSNPHTLEYWYLVASLILVFPPALMYIPIKSWMIESCSSPAEYTTVNGIMMLASLFGGLSAQVILSQASESNPYGGARLCCLFVLVSVPASYLALVCVVPSRELQKAPEQPPIISSFRQCIRTKEFQTIFWNETLLQIASGGAGSLTFPILYLFFGLVHTSSLQVYFAPTLYGVLIGSVACILTLIYALKRIEKIIVYKTIMLIVVFLGMVSVGFMIPGVLAYQHPGLYTPSQQTGHLIGFLATFAFASIMGVCMNFCQGLLVRDLITFDTFTNGLNRESMYQTAISIPAQLLASIPTNFVLGILYSTGFRNLQGPRSIDPYVNETYGWNESTMIQLICYTGLYSCVVGFGAYYLMKNYGLTTAVATKMEEINHKKDDRKKSLAAKKEKDENVRDAGDTENGLLSSSLESMDMSAPLALEDESNLMNHLSQLENKAIKESSNVNGKNEALTRIRNSILLGGGVLAPAAMIALLIGVIFQIEHELPFITLLLTMFESMAMYVGYEAFRYLAVRKLFAMPAEDAKALSIRQVGRNEKYTMNLKEALDKAEIDETAQDDTIPDDDSTISRLTMTRRGSMKSILEVPGLEDEKHPLSGYKRIFGTCTILLICGILGAIQKA